ncbi:alpha-beta hydrolase superfamily lysophospholipase [Williamsia limnetica]|uniref:Alpha-beta hydrolase superfamily lysophospholipase n=1 Tax=Williamsia limnetica TaxID=882452 RepID=A0A318RB20_WILLI|nr:alpha/beta fold hydrolase [Williamsia limnetica]PYE12204.1 alpha-beta hydrolase superfamily lysophospholipase [Williamsia limnetica]
MTAQVDAPRVPDFATISFRSGGTRCEAWHFVAGNDTLTRPAGRPIVVMAHGLGGTKDSGLVPYAERLAAAGLDVFAFDYRGFGASGGVDRQSVSISGQLEDYRAAVSAATAIEGVDAKRVVLWGVSLSGGHVLSVGSGRGDVAAIIAMTPLVNGLAAGRLALGHVPASSIARSTGLGMRSRVRKRMGRAPIMMPIVAGPGEVGALTLPGYRDDYLAIAGPTWQNTIDAAIGQEIGSYRADRDAAGITAPVLMQIADFDRSAPTHSAANAAVKARAEVRHYPCDHFGVYHGQAWFERAVAHQIQFLVRHLAPRPASDHSPGA